MTTATAYLVLEGTRNNWGRVDADTGLKPVDSVRVVKALANRPANLARDQIAVKVQIQIPGTAFDPIAPSALVVVPEDFIQRGPIEVEVSDTTEAGDNR